MEKGRIQKLYKKSDLEKFVKQKWMRRNKTFTFKNSINKFFNCIVCYF